MGQYNKAVLTTAGENLIARALAGEIKLSITKAKTSDFAYPDNADLKRLTDMQGIRQTVCDPETVVFNETIIQTRVLFSNEDIASTYYIHNIGLYVMDGTNEVLFSIVTAEMPDEMPQYNGVASTSYIYNIQNVVQDAPQLNITVNPSGTATIQDVLERVDAIGGDISETVIETLDTVEDKYPIPAAGESVKRFFGKVLTFMKNIRPLSGDKIIYVSANTGSDTDGDGTQSNKYATITKALSTIPENLNGFDCIIDIGIGVYDESVVISNFINGRVQLRLSGNITVNNFTIQNAYAVIRTIGQSFSLTCNWLFVTDSGNVLSLIAVNWNITGYKEYLTRNTSIIIDNTSNLTASGIIALTGNTDVAVFAVNNSRAGLGTIRGTGFDTGFYSYRNGLITCTVNNLIATRLYGTDNGGIIVKSSGAVIGTLSTDVNLYIATTGSDTIGDGTSGNPFKTIQHAIDILPKDLGGYTGNIHIATGIYPEEVIISGFSTSGVIKLILSGDISTDTFTVLGSNIIITSSTSEIHSISTNSLLITDGANFHSWATIMWNIYYFRSTPAEGSFSMCVARGSTSYVSGQMTLSGNTGTGISILACSTAFFGTLHGTGLTYGVRLSNLSKFNCIVNNLSATTKLFNDGGGMEIQPNGTQISGLITSGLSCTWGTIGGGYVRHGNLSGTAIITLSISISPTIVLSAYGLYRIYGIPRPFVENISIQYSSQAVMANCYVENGGAIVFQPTSNVPLPSGFLFSATYLTNS